MRLKFKWIYTLLLAFIMQVSFAQTKTINGTVSEGGMPLPGVSVVKKGSTEGTQTDLDGKYSIQAKQGDVLVFSFVGMSTKEVSVGASNTVNVGLEAESNVLEGVIVEGYKQTSRVKSSNAVVTVSAEAIQDRPNANFMQTLQGQVAGLQIATGSGQPGANSTVILRGRGSINGNVEPLYIIDGVQMNTDNFRSINPNEIESVSVLKDAGATAIYGNRGGNGVIIVTTKGSKFKQKLKVEYTGVTGVTNIQSNDYKVMGTEDILKTERIYGTGMGFGKTDEEIAAIASQYDTNWKKVFFRTGTSQNHNLAISAGGENLSAYTNLAYFKQDGILEGTGINRFNFRNNLSGKSNDGKFRYESRMSVNYSKNNEMNSAGTGGVNTNYVLGANNSLPYFSPSMYTSPADLYSLYSNSSTGLAYTPLMLIDKIRSGFKDTTDEVKFLASFNLSYEILPNLIARTQVGADYNSTNRLVFTSPNSFNALAWQQDPMDGRGSESQSNVRDFQFISTSSLNYSNVFNDKHTLYAGLFFEVNKSHYRTMSLTQNGIDPLYGNPGSSTGWVPFNVEYPEYNLPSVGASRLDASLVSYFGNLDYDYDNRFGVNATIRRDGSYRFDTDNKWGTFWSVSGRWNISNETFMDATSSWISDLKLRASYGKMGNQLISGQNIFSGSNLYADLTSVGQGYNGNPAYLFGQLGYRALRWEVIKQSNIGLDFGFINNRLTGSLDVYRKQTEDLYQSIPLSAATGFGSISGNYGSMRNSGVELFLNYHAIKNDGKGFNLKFNFNGSYNKNELVDLPSDNGVVYNGGNYINREGDMISQFYVVRYAGVNPANGNLLFLDKNGDLTENPNDSDRVYTGKSGGNPKFQGGFGFDIDYHNFFLNTSFTYVTDVYRYDWDLAGLQDPGSLGQFNLSTDMLRAWTPENRYTDIPALKASNLALDSMSDRYIKDASYVRLRSAMFGYNFDRQVLSDLKISSLRLYLQAENYLTWSKWRGWDAESNRSGDQYQYPTPKIFSFGIQLGL